jgi:hypothetical protein
MIICIPFDVVLFSRNDQNGTISEYFAFDWIMTKTQEEKLQLKNGLKVPLIVFIIFLISTLMY